MKLFVIISLLSLVNCAYDIGRKNRALPGGYKTVYVSMFTNQTQVVGAEAEFANAIIRELQRSGFATVTDKDQAELILTGNVISISYSGLSSVTDFRNAQGQAFNATLFTSYRLDAAAAVEIKKATDKSVVWKSTIHGSKNFLAPQLTQPGVRSSNPLYNQSIVDENVRLVAREMMNEAFDQLTENF